MSKCKVCRSDFQKRSMTHKCCSIECAKQYAQMEREKSAARIAKQARHETRAQLEKLKTRQEYLKEAQNEFNAFIRERDRDLPCISCGRHHSGSYHAGHYRSVGAAPHLRFNEQNVHKQCAPCNLYKSGNAIEYRIGLVQRIGQESVETIETDSTIRKWTIQDAKDIKAHYKQKLKDIKA